MADRYPLVANASTLTIEELPISDTILIDNLVVSNTANLGDLGNITITGGSSGQVIKTDGNGVLTWSTDTTAAAGSNTQIQFNNNGSLGACSSMTYNTTSSTFQATNIRGTNVTSTGTLTMATSLPGTPANGMLAIDIGNNRMGVYYNSSWRYTPISGNSSATGNANVYDINISNTANINSNGYVFFRTSDNNTKFAALTGPGNISGANGTYIAWALPSTSGNVGEFLTTDGAGNMQFATAVSSSAPGTSSSTGQAGQIAFDSGYIYVCIATDTWKRAALTTF